MEQNIFELKEAIERIEDKLISAEKIYTAIQFQVWMVVMIVYYIIITPLSTIPWQLTAIYWISALLVVAYISSKILKRMRNLFKSYGSKTRSSARFGLGIVLSWVTGSITGWMIIPSFLLQNGVEEMSAIAIGFLSFISLSIFGMFLTFKRSTQRSELEMVPAFAIPALAVLVVPQIQTAQMAYAGFCVASAFGITVLAYMYTAFRVLR